MGTNNKEQQTKNIPSWIADGSYKSKEWQEAVEKIMKEIRGSDTPEGIAWCPCSRAVI